MLKILHYSTHRHSAAEKISGLSRNYKGMTLVPGPHKEQNYEKQKKHQND